MKDLALQRRLLVAESKARLAVENPILSKRATHGVDGKLGRKIGRRRLHRAHRRGGPMELVPTTKIGVCGRCGRYGLIGPAEEQWPNQTCRGQVQPNPYNQRQHAGSDRSDRCLPRKNKP